MAGSYWHSRDTGIYRGHTKPLVWSMITCVHDYNNRLHNTNHMLGYSVVLATTIISTPIRNMYFKRGKKVHMLEITYNMCMYLYKIYCKYKNYGQFGSGYEPSRLMTPEGEEGYCGSGI